MTILLCNTFGAKAQKGLLLTDAIDIALQNSQQVKVSSKRITMAKQQIKTANLANLPIFTADMRQYNSFQNVSDPANFLRGAYTNAGLEVGINGIWSLYNGNRANIEKDRLNGLVKTQKGNKKNAEDATIEQVMKAYIRALAAKERINLWKKILKISSRQLRNEKLKRAAEVSSDFDLLQVENAHLSDSTNLLIERSNYQQALIGLNLRMGESINKQFFPTDIFKYEKTNKYQGLETLKNKMLDNNQSLKNQQLSIDLLQNNFKANQAQLKPRINVNGGLVQNVSRTRFAKQEGQFGNNRNFYLNISLSYTLFDGGAVKQKNKETRIERDIRKLELNGLKGTLLNELKRLLYAYKHQLGIIRVYEKIIKNNGKNMELAEQRLQNTFSTYIEYRAIQRSYTNAEIAKLDALLNLKIIDIDIQKLIGGFEKYKKK